MRRLLPALVLTLLVSACAADLPRGIEPVQDFQVDRYLGRWYEIARLNHSFERELQQVSAEYSLRDDGRVRVINRGWNVEENQWEQVEGKARFAESSDVGWLEVSFFGPFYGTYAVFELDEDYQQAYVIGDDRSTLWFLSRTPEVSEADLERFREAASARDIDLDELILVDQDVATEPPPAGS